MRHGASKSEVAVVPNSGVAAPYLLNGAIHPEVAPAVVTGTTTAARLLGLGCAVPGLSQSQAQVAGELAETWCLRGSRLSRWQRIIAGTNIDFRHGVVPLATVVHLSTAQRMKLYEAHAPPLAVEAAQRALASAGVDAASVTDLFVVSCTGFSAPGLDVDLVERLGLSPRTRRCMIGFMGCFGAISGLRAAVGACCADPGAVALVVCCELCSLHLPPRPGLNDLVAAALFGDGAAAAVVAGSRSVRETASGGGAARSIGRLTVGRSRLIAEGREWMTWRITDAGFAMTLDKAVPEALRRVLASFVDEAGPQWSGCYIVHPGGPGILEAVDEALALDGAYGLECSWQVLRQYGNMSSATVLFVLETMQRSGGGVTPGLLLAFGPGLTIESIGLEAG